MGSSVTPSLNQRVSAFLGAVLSSVFVCSCVLQSILTLCYLSHKGKKKPLCVVMSGHKCSTYCSSTTRVSLQRAAV